MYKESCINFYEDDKLYEENDNGASWAPRMIYLQEGEGENGSHTWCEDSQKDEIEIYSEAKYIRSDLAYSQITFDEWFEKWTKENIKGSSEAYLFAKLAWAASRG